MKELLLLTVLVFVGWLLRRSLGPARRRPPGERTPPGPVPEREEPLADTPIILGTGGHDGP